MFWPINSLGEYPNFNENSFEIFSIIPKVFLFNDIIKNWNCEVEIKSFLFLNLLSVKFTSI